MALEGAQPKVFVGPPAQPWTHHIWLHLHDRKVTIHLSLKPLTGETSCRSFSDSFPQTPLWLQDWSGEQALSLSPNSESLQASKGLPGCSGSMKE